MSEGEQTLYARNIEDCRKMIVEELHPWLDMIWSVISEPLPETLAAALWFAVRAEVVTATGRVWEHQEEEETRQRMDAVLTDCVNMIDVLRSQLWVRVPPLRNTGEVRQDLWRMGVALESELDCLKATMKLVLGKLKVNLWRISDRL
jgi:hypothetical protein